MSTDPNVERGVIVGYLAAILPPGTIVHPYERENLIDYDPGKDGESLHGYCITNADPEGRNPETRRPLDTDAYIVDRTWTIRGFYSRDDENSEQTFRAELHVIMDGLLPHRSLGHTVQSTEFPMLFRFTPLEGMGYKFHYAEVVFATRSEGSYTPD
jgi:hypothetical protein